MINYDSSCLMVLTTLYTPIPVDSLFKDSDLFGKGVEDNSHITVLYKKGEDLVPKDGLLLNIEEALGKKDFEIFSEFLKREEAFPVNSIFELSSFDLEDHACIILKLREGNKAREYLDILNKNLSEKFNVVSDFEFYQPHITLAYVTKDSKDKYLSDETLKKVLEKSLIRFEDFMLSWGRQEEVGDENNMVWYITTYHAVERHLRLQREAREKELYR